MGLSRIPLGPRGSRVPSPDPSSVPADLGTYRTAPWCPRGCRENEGDSGQKPVCPIRPALPCPPLPLSTQPLVRQTPALPLLSSILQGSQVRMRWDAPPPQPLLELAL